MLLAVQSKSRFYDEMLASYEARALAIIVAAALLKIAICPFIGLGVNEAYAIASGRIPSLSYFDHPPFHFWLAHLSELVFGDTPFARIPFILLSAGTSWLMFLLARELFSAAAAVWSVAVLNLSIFFSLMSGNWILPDGPLNFFLLATALALTPVALGKPIKLVRWLIAGAFAGLAAISKYHAFLFVAGFFVFLFVSHDRRKVLASPGPWCAAIIMMLIFSPVLFWNAQHSWVSLKFQGGRAIPHGLAIGKFLSLAGAQLMVLLPASPVPLFAGIRESFLKPEARREYLCWLGLPTCALFTFVPLATHSGMLHWSMPGWLILMPLGGTWLAENTKIAWPMIKIAAIAFLIFIAGGLTEFQTGALGKMFPKALRHGAPTAENVSWHLLNRFVTSDPAKTIVVSNYWRDASKIDQGLGGKYRVLVSSDDPRNFAVGLNRNAFAGRAGWIIVRSDTSQSQLNRIRYCFRHTDKALEVSIKGLPSRTGSLSILGGRGFVPSSCELPSFNG